MILHSIPMLAIFMSQSTQTPQQIQYVLQTSPEPWEKWLLPTIIQTVISLASIVAGVGIAFWSFRKNRENEEKQWERNQRAAREQWIRDKKKEEWQKLIIQAARIEQHMPSVAIGGDLIRAVKGGELEDHLRHFTQATLECVFAAGVLEEGGVYERLVNLQQAKEKAIIDMGAYELSPAEAHSRGLPRPLEIAQIFQTELAAILREVHNLAKKDLEIP